MKRQCGASSAGRARRVRAATSPRRAPGVVRVQERFGEPGPHLSGTVSRTLFLTVRWTQAGAAGMRAWTASGTRWGTGGRGSGPSSPKPPSPRPPAPSFCAFSSPRPWLHSSMEAAAHPPWWDESGRLHSAPSPIALQKRVSFYSHFNASLTLVMPVHT